MVLALELLVTHFRHNTQLVTILLALLIGVEAWALVPSMFEKHDPYPDYYYFVLPVMNSCELDELPHINGQETRGPLKWYINCLSYKIFDNHKTIPILFSIGLMPLVYYLGYYISRDRIIGILSLIAFTYNPIYNDWNHNGTYDQVWAFFLILSVVILFKYQKGGGAIASYFISIFAKALTLLYLPVWLYTIYKTEKPRQVRLAQIVATLIILITLGYVTLSYLEEDLGFLVGNEIGFYPENWDQALFRNISILWQVIPALLLFFGVYFYFKTGYKPKNIGLVFAWMLFIVLTTPIIHLFTQQNQYTYRFVPFAAFMSIFISMVIVKVGYWVRETRLKAVT